MLRNLTVIALAMLLLVGDVKAGAIESPGGLTATAAATTFAKLDASNMPFAPAAGSGSVYIDGSTAGDIGDVNLGVLVDDILLNLGATGVNDATFPTYCFGSNCAGSVYNISDGVTTAPYYIGTGAFGAAPLVFGTQNLERLRLGVTGGAIVFNDIGVDIDTRMETDANANAFVLDAGAETLSLGVPILVNVSASKFGSTTANLLTSNVLNTGGTETYWIFDSPAAGGSDITAAFRHGGTDAMLVYNSGVVTVVGDLNVNGGDIVLSDFDAAMIYANRSSSGNSNLILYSLANAVGEIAVSVGTRDALTGATLDTTLLAIGEDLDDATPDYVVQIDGNGHITLGGGAPGDFTTGSCTSDSGVGNDTRGTLTGTCTAQTLIVPFSRTRDAAPYCTISPTNAAAWSTVTGLAYTTSTTALTITVTTATVAGTWTYLCLE